MKLKRVARNLNRNGWRRLEGTRLEAMVISQLVSASNRREVYDFDANFNWANSPQLQQYRYLHFATHGFAEVIRYYPLLKQGKDLNTVFGDS